MADSDKKVGTSEAIISGICLSIIVFSIPIIYYILVIRESIIALDMNITGIFSYVLCLLLYISILLLCKDKRTFFSTAYFLTSFAIISLIVLVIFPELSKINETQLINYRRTLLIMLFENLFLLIEALVHELKGYIFDNKSKNE